MGKAQMSKKFLNKQKNKVKDLVQSKKKKLFKVRTTTQFRRKKTKLTKGGMKSIKSISSEINRNKKEKENFHKVLLNPL